MNEYNDDYHEWICTDILLFQIHTSDGAVTFTRCTGFVGIEFNEENIVCFDIPNAAALCLLKKCLLSRIIFGEIRSSDVSFGRFCTPVTDIIGEANCTIRAFVGIFIITGFEQFVIVTARALNTARAAGMANTVADIAVGKAIVQFIIIKAFTRFGRISSGKAVTRWNIGTQMCGCSLY